MKLGYVIFVLSLTATFCAAKRRYDGYKVYRFQVDSVSDAEVFDQLERRGLYDFWSSAVPGRWADIMTSPELEDHLLTWAVDHQFEYRIWIEDAQSLIDAEDMARQNKKKQPKDGSPVDWDSYHTLQEIYDFYDYITANYNYTEVENIGVSYEGRDMLVLKVCRGGCGSKPAMWIDGGIHAREWVAPAAVTWMVKEVVENDQQHPHLTQQLDWYFLAVHNPDGYVFSFEGDRFWRKTRSQWEGIQMEYDCYGTDANRNFDLHWGDYGGTDYGCAETYFGPEAFSEVEAVNVRDFILKHRENIKFYNTLHAFGQLVLVPWGYTEEPTPDHDAMIALAEKGNAALYAVHGEVYRVGCIPCVLYFTSGTAIDWVYGVAGIPYTYSIELRDTGEFGFMLPENLIIPTAEENWAFHAVAAEEMIAEFGNK